MQLEWNAQTHWCNNSINTERKRAMNAFRRCVAPGLSTWPIQIHNHRPHTFQSNRTSTFFFIQQFITSNNSKQRAFFLSILLLFPCICISLSLSQYKKFIVVNTVSGRSVASWMRVRCDWIKCLISIYTNYKPLFFFSPSHSLAFILYIFFSTCVVCFAYASVLIFKRTF